MPDEGEKEGFFPETREKNVLRLRDRVLVEKLSAEKKRRLLYCGLSGVNAVDVLLWKEYLERAIIVQRPFDEEDEEDDFKTNLILRLNAHFNGGIKIVISDIWDYLSSPAFPILGIVPDVFNLDFCGGLIYETRLEYPKQRSAFQNIFSCARNASHDFLLLLTLMPRDKGKEAYKSYLKDHMDAIVQSARLADQDTLVKKFDASFKFHGRNNLALFKACIPILLTEIGRSYNYSVKLEYCRLYTKMIHLAFSCSFVKSVLGMAPDSSDTIRYINQPLRKLLADGTEEQSYPPQVTLE